VRLLRRIFVAVFLAGFSAAIMRLRGTGGTPPQHGGWKPLELADEPPVSRGQPATEEQPG
jgi:hypothetical protein